MKASMISLLLVLIFSQAALANPLSEEEKIAQGKALYLSPGKGGCVSCHGQDGLTPIMPMYPTLGGQSEQYLVNQMKDYKNKKRKNGLFMTMEVAMAHYTLEEMQLMAIYLSSVSNHK